MTLTKRGKGGTVSFSQSRPVGSILVVARHRDQKTAGGLGGAVSPPAGPGQSPGGGPGGEAPGSSVNLGILKP